VIEHVTCNLDCAGLSLNMTKSYQMIRIQTTNLEGKAPCY